MNEEMNPNHNSAHEQLPDYQEARESKLPAHEKAQESAVEKNKDSIETIRDSIERKAEKSEEIIKHKTEAEQPKKVSYLSAGLELKNHSLRQIVAKTQRKLPAYQRAFSKVIHNPDVDIASEVAGQTIARPSGLLFGGFFSAFGSLALLLICNHYGYEYNFTIAIACFVGGFFLGLLFELFYRITRKSPA